jgi:hypothetical protein
MQVTSERVGTEQAAEGARPVCPPRCPVCNGPLVELRATLRCSRCYFSICEGCAGDPGDAFLGAGD